MLQDMKKGKKEFQKTGNIDDDSTFGKVRLILEIFNVFRAKFCRIGIFSWEIYL